MQVIRTLRKGLPRFVVFIMCDVDDGAASCDVAMSKKKKQRKRNARREEGVVNKRGGGREEQAQRSNRKKEAGGIDERAEGRVGTL